MTAHPHLEPGPDHPITLMANPKRVVVTADGKVIVDTTRALVMQESTYPAVHYVPREDADMSTLSRTDQSTHCPYKGDARYFSIEGLDRGENAVWTYEAPHDAVAEIKDHLAFYADRVTIEER